MILIQLFFNGNCNLKEVNCFWKIIDCIPKSETKQFHERLIARKKPYINDYLKNKNFFWKLLILGY